MMNKRHIEVINGILKIATSHEANYTMTTSLHKDGYRVAEIQHALKQLEDDGLLTFGNEAKQTFQLTNRGYFAASDGYEIFVKEVWEKEQEEKKLNELQKKMILLNYQNALIAKYGYWVTTLLSLTALIVAIIALK